MLGIEMSFIPNPKEDENTARKADRETADINYSVARVLCGAAKEDFQEMSEHGRAVFTYKLDYFGLINTPTMIRTILLLTASNIFMTFAWYGHLKFTGMPLWKAILISWLIAFLEYCLMVPANRLGYVGGLSGYQLKVTQEVITLIVFSIFAVYYLKEPFHWRYLLSFALLIAAVYVMFKK